MAYTIKRFGKTPEWGIGNATSNAVIVTSISATPNLKEQEFENGFGQTIGKLIYDCNYSMSVSGTVLFEHAADVPEAGTAVTAADGVITVGTGDNKIEISPYLPAGADKYFGANSTIICEGGGISSSAGDAVTFDMSFTAYDFT